MNWPKAPQPQELRAIYENRGALPKVGNTQPRWSNGGAWGPSVSVGYSGTWLYMVPRPLWNHTPLSVRVALSVLHRAGYLSVEEILDADPAELVKVENVGERRVRQVKEWAERMASVRDTGCDVEAYDRGFRAGWEAARHQMRELLSEG